MFAELIRDQAPAPDEAFDLGLGSSRRESVWPDAEPDWHGIDPWALEDDRADASAAADAAAGGAGGPVEESELGSLSYSELRDRMVELVAERNRIEGEYLAVLGELTSRYGTQAAAYELRDLTRMNSSQARAESRLARSLADHDMSDTLDALRAGEIHMSHAKVIAREAPKQHRRSEHSFLGLCREYPSDTVAKHTLAFESQQVYADLAAEAAANNLSPIDAELAMQRHERFASLRMGDDGMWHLNGKFDFLTGRELNTALEAQLRSLRRRAESGSASTTGTDSVPPGDSTNDSSDPVPTRRQLLADALSELVAGTARARHAKNNLIIVADYDVTGDRLANPRLDDGTPLSARMLVEHAVDAKVLPAMFSADWSQLALGRTRNASDAQRLVLAVRDGGCIGCELTSEHTQAHHIDYFENDGPTDIPNLASLCEPCHQDLHNHKRRIATPANGRPQLQPPEPRNTDPPVEDAAARSTKVRDP